MNDLMKFYKDKKSTIKIAHNLVRHDHKFIVIVDIYS